MALDQQQYRQDCQSCSLLGGVIEESVWKKVPSWDIEFDSESNCLKPI